MKVKRAGTPTAQFPHQQYHFFCPGCEHAHAFNASWSYNGDGDNPTVHPSILVTGGGDPNYRCHSFIESGRIRFLPDCSHKLAGQTVDLPELDQ